MLPTALVTSAVIGCVAFGITGDRGPVSLAEGDVTVIGEDVLDLTVPSCDGDPQLVSLTQNDEAVTVEVVTTDQDDGPACADVLRVELEEPLGDREVIDATSGETGRITVLEVVDRDDVSRDARE